VLYSFFQDQGSGQYSFRRLVVEAQQRIPGVRDDQRLTLHGFVSTTDADEGKVVPFYLQETLGGAGSVRGFHDEIIGSDGSKATLRGFQDLRFRGPHAILLQAEYRFGIWGPLDGTVFADAGKTTSARRDLNLTHLKRDFGFSLSLMTGDATALRLETGFGGREGTHVFLSVGPIFAQ
jgi:outer membrane protein assembly factor BamA